MIKASFQKISTESQLFKSAQQAYINDCFAIESNQLDLPIEEIYARLMSKTPKWFDILMRMRDRMVAILGLKSTQDMAGGNSLFAQSGEKFGLKNHTQPSKILDFFEVVALSENEIILSIKDSHLDMQTSLLRDKIDHTNNTCRISFNDVIITHNFLGKAYLFFIMPIHKIIVEKTLNDGKQRGDI